MVLDQLSVWLSVSALILGLLTVIMVGSQTRGDAWSVSCWTMVVMVPMLLLSCVVIAVSRNHNAGEGATGLVVLCSGIIAAAVLGYRFAVSRDRALEGGLKGKTAKSPIQDDELA
jgi:hypothetical protein